MDTFSAFAMGQANRGRPMMVFDWLTAAKIIKERNPEYAIAGLSGDEGYTAGAIYRDGKVVKNEYTYLASTWAKPILIIDDERIPCYVMEPDTEWDEHTKWPEEALAVLS